MAVCTLEHIETLNEEALRSALARDVVTPKRYHLPLSKEDAERALVTALRVETERRGRTFTLTEGLGKVLSKTARFLTAPEEYHNTFGLYLCGGVGGGKTTLARAIMRLLNTLGCADDEGGFTYVRFTTALELSYLCRQAYDEFRLVRATPMLIIDDLGVEPTKVMDWGNGLTPLVELLSYRYDKQLFTIVTTNLSVSDVREKYGERVADRFNEMMTTIVFTDASFRERQKTTNTETL